MKTKGFKEIKEAVELKTMLCYEKLMLDNYYKARTINNDKYFKDENAKQEIGESIESMVGDILVGQARSILSKEDLTLAQITEVEAIIHLCSPKQAQTIKDLVNKMDGKVRRNATNIIKEIERRR